MNTKTTTTTGEAPSSRVPVRLVFVVLAVLVAGAAVSVLKSDDEPSTDPGRATAAGQTPGTSGNSTNPLGGSSSFDPAGGAGNAGATDPAPDTDDEVVKPPEEIKPDPLPGTPTKDGTVVSLHVPYRKGTVSRYRISSTLLDKERNSGVSHARRDTRYLRTEVVKGDGSGPAIVRCVEEDFRTQVIAGAGHIWEYDTRSPREEVLQDPNVAVVVKPRIASYGLPTEVRLDKTGFADVVDGADAKQEAFLEVLQLIDPEAARGVDLHAAERELDLMRQWLFPPVGGGELKAGETREFKLRIDTVYRAWIHYEGELRVTKNDDDAFVVEVHASPRIEMREPRADREQKIYAVRVVFSRIPPAVQLSWRFDRKTGRLLGARHRMTFRLDVSFDVRGQPGGRDFAPQFIDRDSLTVIDLLEDE